MRVAPRAVQDCVVSSPRSSILNKIGPWALGHVSEQEQLRATRIGQPAPECETVERPAGLSFGLPR
eukprot:11206484-Lingulodinium_polyedra.AAC.1